MATNDPTVRRPRSQRSVDGQQARQGAAGRSRYGGPQSQGNRTGGTSRGGGQTRGPFRHVAENVRSGFRDATRGGSSAGPRQAAGLGGGGSTSTATGRARQAAGAANRAGGAAMDTAGKWGKRAWSSIRAPMKAAVGTARFAKNAFVPGIGLTAASYGLPAVDRAFGGEVGEAAAENVDGQMGPERAPSIRQQRARLANFHNASSRAEAPANTVARDGPLRTNNRAEGTGRSAAYEPPGQGSAVDPGGAVPESARGMETGQGEDATFESLPQIASDFMDSIGPAARERAQRERGQTLGPASIRSARADTNEALDIQQDAGVSAPALEGDESEQDVVTVQDGQGGAGALRTPAGMREGGGTLSVVGSDTGPSTQTTAGLRRARRAAAARGDWDAVERSFMSPDERRAADRETRREELRDTVSSSEGFDQSLGSMVQEGIRRRAASQELATMEAEDAQMREQRASLRRARASNRPGPLEIARFQADRSDERYERSQGAIDRGLEFGRQIFTRTDAEGNEVVDNQGFNQARQMLERSGMDPTTDNFQTVKTLSDINDALNEQVAEEDKITFADAWGGGPDNPLDMGVPVVNFFSDALGATGNEPPDPYTVADSLSRIANMAQTREDEDWVWNDRVVNVGGRRTGVDAEGNPQFEGGMEMELSDIPTDVRQAIEHLRQRQGIGNGGSLDERGSS